MKVCAVVVHESLFCVLEVNQDDIMDGIESASQDRKRKKFLWEYVLEPVNKATYWDHAAVATEERRVQAKRTFLFVGSTQPGRRSLKVAKDDVDDLVCNEKAPKKSKCNKDPAFEQHYFKGVRCAERGGSAMMLWQHEFYYVLEIEETRQWSKEGSSSLV